MRADLVQERAVTLRFTGQAPPYGELVLIVRRILIERGFAPWADTEADCFAADGDVLVIARPGRARVRAFRFPDLETLLCAVYAMPGEGGALYAAEEGYILTAPPGEVCSALYEFGTEAPLTPEREAHLREQERRILAAGAAGVLRRTFDGI